MVYDTLRTVSTVERKQRQVLFVQLQPAIHCSLAWGHLHNVILSDGARSAWYMVTHDIMPRMYGCVEFDWLTRKNVDSAGGRTPYYIESQEIWEWTRTRWARIQRKNPNRIPKEWSHRPCLKPWLRRYIRRLCGVWWVWYFMWWIRAWPNRDKLHWLHATDMVEDTK